MSFQLKVVSKYEIISGEDKSLLFVKPKTKKEAENWVKNTVQWFGGGYHPDTNGKEYVDQNGGQRSFTAQEAKMFDAANAAAQELIDVYQIALPATKKLFTLKVLEIKLGAAKNPDFEDVRDPIIKPFKQKVSSLEEAQKVARKFIDDNLIGGGSWYAADAGWVFENGKKIARIAYNGTIIKD
jgi:hypothetical protein